jgi:hypothetical protein
MAQGDDFAGREELGRWLPTLMTERSAPRRFNLAFDFAFVQLDIQDTNVRQIQQLLDLNIHWIALTDVCGLIATISWDISRPLTMKQKSGIGYYRRARRQARR